METGGKARVKGLARIWPSVDSPEGARFATRQAFWAAILCASATLALSVLGVLGIKLFREYGLDFDLSNLFDTYLFGLIACGLWRRSRIAAVGGLLLYVGGIIIQWIVRPPNGVGVVWAVIITLWFTSGIRGTFAYRRFGGLGTGKGDTPNGGNAARSKEEHAIGGWLILVAIGLLVSPLLILINLGINILPTFEPTLWRVLTTPGTKAYHPLSGPIMVFEAIGNIALLCLSAYAIVCFFRKSRSFPTLMISILLILPAYLLLDLVLMVQIPIVAESVPKGFYWFVGGTISSGICVPYFRKSKRVKTTFVR